MRAFLSNACFVLMMLCGIAMMASPVLLTARHFDAAVFAFLGGFFGMLIFSVLDAVIEE